MSEVKSEQDIGDFNERAKARFPNWPELFGAIDSEYGTDQAIFVTVSFGGDSDELEGGATREALETHFGLSERTAEMLFSDDWQFTIAEQDTAARELIEISERGSSDGQEDQEES